MHLALRVNSDMVSSLLSQGADGNTPDADGVPPIHFAAQRNLGLVIKSLVDNGCDVDAIWCLDQTPLLTALKNQAQDAVSALLDMGAKIDIIPESLISLPRTTPLDPRILEVKPMSHPWPMAVKDVYQICYRLREKYSRTIPLTIPIIARIFDMAELWVQSSVIRDDEQMYDRYSNRHKYLQSAPLVGRNVQPVQKITFTITSHDQGYTTVSQNENYTWFEGRKLSTQDKRKDFDWPIIYKRLANSEWHTHRITWSPAEGHQHLIIMRPGDYMAVLVYARYAGWENYVREVRIDVFTSVLRLHYSPDELFDI